MARGAGSRALGLPEAADSVRESPSPRRWALAKGLWRFVRQDVEAQPGKPVTARGLAAQGRPYAKAGVGKVEPLQGAHRAEFRPWAEGCTALSAPRGLPPRAAASAGDPGGPGAGLAATHRSSRLRSLTAAGGAEAREAAGRPGRAVRSGTSSRNPAAVRPAWSGPHYGPAGSWDREAGIRRGPRGAQFAPRIGRPWDR